MSSSRLRGVWASTFFAYALSQALVAVGAFVRIPFITEAVGAHGYGVFVILTSLFTIAHMLATGLSEAVRPLVAAAPDSAEGLLRPFRRAGVIEAAGVGLLGTLATVVVTVWQDLPTEYVVGLLVVILGGVLWLPAGAAQGMLDGLGRSAASQLALSANTLVSLPLVVLVALLAPSVPLLTLAAGLGVIAPAWVQRHLVRRMIRRTTSTSSGDQVSVEDVFRLVAPMTVFSLGILLAYAFDALIVGAVLGPVQAGAYGLASRIMSMVTVLPLAVQGLTVVQLTRKRESGDVDAFLHAIRRQGLLIGGIGAAVALVGMIVGPWLGGVLGRGEVPVPWPLYVWIGLHGILTAASTPLMSAYANPHGARQRGLAAITCGLANIVLSAVGALLVGVEGPAIATVACSGAMVAYLWWQARRSPRLILGTTGPDLEQLADQPPGGTP